ncbi:MAG TPA: hypothetical protein VMV33_17110 [Rhodocyclaceae bacterium]|nr:hypothetical protein [Rhodocyclaceae bacterium]
MSGNGNTPNRVPGRVFGQVLVAEPAVDAGGRLAPWLAQFLVRLAALVGPVVTNDGTSITGAVSNVQASVLSLVGSTGTDAATQAALAELFDQVDAPRPPAPDVEAVAIGGPGAPALDCCVPALAPLEPWAQSGDVSVATAIYAPLVNGDLPGPTLVADPYGQCIMVAIT